MVGMIDRLGPRQKKAIEHIKRSRSGCSAHHVDLGLIPQEDLKRQHEAVRRLAHQFGIDTSKPWIGKTTQQILNLPLEGL